MEKKVSGLKGKKIVVTVSAAVLLLALYVVIFGFSAQDAEQSGSLSRRISEGCIEFLNSLSGGHWSAAFVDDLSEYFEHPIRKLAHFSEYMCMGILVYLVWRPWLERKRRMYCLVVLWVFLSGTFDEIHQLFVPGRWCSLADVLLDTCGGAFGLLLCIAAEKGFSRARGRSSRRSQAAHDLTS